MVIWEEEENRERIPSDYIHYQSFYTHHCCYSFPSQTCQQPVKPKPKSNCPTIPPIPHQSSQSPDWLIPIYFFISLSFSLLVFLRSVITLAFIILSSTHRTSTITLLGNFSPVVIIIINIIAILHLFAYVHSIVALSPPCQLSPFPSSLLPPLFCAWSRLIHSVCSRGAVVSTHACATN